MNTSGFVISSVGEAQRVDAAKKLLGAPQNADSDSAIRMLRSATSLGVDLSHFYSSSDPDTNRPRQVCLGVYGSGRSAMLFASPPRTRQEEQELAAVIRHACERMERARIHQALLDAGDYATARSLVLAGFVSVGILLYMRRPTPSRTDTLAADVAAVPDGFVIRRFHGSDEGALIDALERTYIKTLDCPELCGMRETRDVYDSHRATGRFDPQLWWLLERDNRIEGMALFNASPEQGSIELTYLGLSPEVRGRGMGRMLLENTLLRLIGRSEPYIACAVDQRNVPARRVYESLRFESFASRAAFVRAAGIPVENAPVRP